MTIERRGSDARRRILKSFGEGRYEEALTLASALTQRRPADGFAWKALGTICSKLGHDHRAREALERAATLTPGDYEVHLNLGILHRRGGTLADAQAAYARALRLAPGVPGAWVGLGNVLKDAGRLLEAERAFRHALELDPRLAVAHLNLGLLLAAEREHEHAEEHFRRAVALVPSDHEAHNGLGNVLKAARRHTEAEAHYRRALQLAPQFVQARVNLGIVLQAMRRMFEARDAYEQALAIDPQSTAALTNLGSLLRQTEPTPEAAEALYRRALQIDPAVVDARWNLAMLLLTHERFRESWPHFEARLELGGARRPQPPGQPWRGEPLAGKSILILSEQGHGDCVQFCRYMRLLKEARGAAHVSIICGRALAPLLQTTPGLDAALIDQSQAGDYDYWSYLMSLPRYFDTTLQTIPSALPYLSVLPERSARWRDRLPKTGFRVGLVWKGNPAHENDANRSLPGLDALAPLWTANRVTFVSLQKGAGEDECRLPSALQPIVDLGSSIEDFADTAAIVSQLDLLISVDTAAVHVAGALAIPCWVLVPAMETDWRWLLERSDSPWYPGALRLFRQRPGEDWTPTIERIAAALRARTQPSG